jgi:hypothetical protein
VKSLQRKRYNTSCLSAPKHIPVGCNLHFEAASNTDAAPVQAMRSNVVVQFYRELVAVSTLAMHSRTSALLGICRCSCQLSPTCCFIVRYGSMHMQPLDLHAAGVQHASTATLCLAPIPPYSHQPHRHQLTSLAPCVQILTDTKLNILLVALPFAIASHLSKWGDTPTFILSMIALCPLAEVGCCAELAELMECAAGSMLRRVALLMSVHVHRTT